MSMDMVIWHDKCVWYHTNCSSSITCKKCDIRNCFIIRPTIIQKTQINCVKVSALLLADGHCGQMSVEYDPVKLATTGIKIHVTQLFDMSRNHTHLCISYVI